VRRAELHSGRILHGDHASFARKGITSRNIPIKSALIDSSSSRLQNGSPIVFLGIIAQLADDNFGPMKRDAFQSWRKALAVAVPQRTPMDFQKVALAIAPSFLLAICSIPSFGNREIRRQRLPLGTSKNTSKAIGRSGRFRELLLMFEK
jgi:hypothetical protein